MSRPLRLAFAGTPDFAVPALEALARTHHSVAVVYTQPDRPAGRGQKLSASPVAVAARNLGIPVEQPATLQGDDALPTLQRHAVDVMVVAAYGLILPPAILAVPRLGCINIHASLLPRWRGAAPIERAILAGDPHTGVSIMSMEAGLDTGPVYARSAIEIGSTENAGELQARLATLGARTLLEVLDGVAGGTAHAQSQDAAAATYARKIDKREALIDWSAPAAAIANAVRAFNPRPIAETRWRGTQLRVWQAHVVDLAEVAGPGLHGSPGQVLPSAPGTLAVACGAGALAIDVLQLPGKRPAAVREFCNAHDLGGAVLGGT